MTYSFSIFPWELSNVVFSTLPSLRDFLHTEEHPKWAWIQRSQDGFPHGYWWESEVLGHLPSESLIQVSYQKGSSHTSCTRKKPYLWCTVPPGEEVFLLHWWKTSTVQTNQKTWEPFRWKQHSSEGCEQNH